MSYTILTQEGRFGLVIQFFLHRLFQIKLAQIHSSSFFQMDYLQYTIYQALEEKSSQLIDLMGIMIYLIKMTLLLTFLKE